jgi:hypothetical protein
MRKGFRHWKLLVVVSMMLWFAALEQPCHAATIEQYVVVLPGPTCSIVVGNIDIKSFRLLIPASRLRSLANNTAIVQVHVCECYLLQGDPQKCALDAVTKAARQVPMAQQEATMLGGQIFMLVEDSTDFAKLYSALSSAYPPQTGSPASRILHGIGAPPGRAAAPPPQPPPPGGRLPSPVGEQQNKKKSCEVSPSVCIDPKTDELSAEFEFKCEGLPTFVFSTDGKAGLKIGPLEVSVSANDRH